MVSMTSEKSSSHLTANKKILIGLSGGVDSAVAAFLLQESGLQVLALTMITSDAGWQQTKDAAEICRALALEHLIVDVRERFHEAVVEDFVDSYTRGLTPNPCILCNPVLKFSVLYEYAKDHNCDGMASGHYAKINRLENGRFALAKASESYKDQSYFLSRLTQEQLAILYFPLESYDKSQVRALAEQHHLRTDTGASIGQKADSQDNCFIEGDYATYIRTYLQKYNPSLLYLTEPGDILDENNHVIGRHKGSVNYTIGQRKGFNVQTTKRLFVLDKDVKNNTITVGPHDQLLRRKIIIKDIVFSGLSSLEEPLPVWAKIRYSAKEVPALLTKDKFDSTRLKVEFEQAVIAPVAGQTCVLYRDDMVMASGFIEKSFR